MNTNTHIEKKTKRKNKIKVKGKKINHRKLLWETNQNITANSRKLYQRTEWIHAKNWWLNTLLYINNKIYINKI